jgi:hypothetical protein
MSAGSVDPAFRRGRRLHGASMTELEQAIRSLESSLESNDGPVGVRELMLNVLAGLRGIEKQLTEINETIRSIKVANSDQPPAKH